MIERRDGEVGARVAEAVARALPQWSGLGESLRADVRAARTQPTLVATGNAGGVGS